LSPDAAIRVINFFALIKWTSIHLWSWSLCFSFGKITLFYLLGQYTQVWVSLHLFFQNNLSYISRMLLFIYAYTDCPSTLFQLKDLAEKLPLGVYDTENIRPTYLPNGLEPNGIHSPYSNGEQQHSRAESISGSSLASMELESSLLNRTVRNLPGTNGTNLHQQIRIL